MTYVRAALFLSLPLGLTGAGCARAPYVSEYESDAASADMGEDDAGSEEDDAGSEEDDDALDAGLARDAAFGADSGRAGDRPDAGAPSGRDARPEPAPDSGAATDSGAAPDSASPAADARPPEPGRDSGPEPTPDAAPDPTPDAAVDSGPADTGAPVVDAGLRCEPGTYTGVFEGEISALFGLIEIHISGQISIELVFAGSNDVLQIQRGGLEGSDQDDNPITATVTGALNCASGQLEDGRLNDGTYRRVDPIFGGEPTTVGFTGTVTADYDAATRSAIGRWEAISETGLRGGSGTWTAALRSP